MKKSRLYLETSVITAYFDKEWPDRQNLTKKFWQNLNKFKVYISEMVVLELKNILDSKLREKYLRKSKSFSVLKVDTKEVKELIETYFKRGVLTKKHLRDATHIAVASVNNLDILVSWNFAHIVREKTRRLVNLVNWESGHKELTIVAPPEI